MAPGSGGIISRSKLGVGYWTMKNLLKQNFWVEISGFFVSDNKFLWNLSQFTFGCKCKVNQGTTNCSCEEWGLVGDKARSCNLAIFVSVPEKHKILLS